MKYHLLYLGIILHHLHIQTAYMHWARILNTNNNNNNKQKERRKGIVICHDTFNTSYYLFDILPNIYSNAVWYILFERAQDVQGFLYWNEYKLKNFELEELSKKETWAKLKNML